MFIIYIKQVIDDAEVEGNTQDNNFGQFLELFIIASAFNVNYGLEPDFVASFGIDKYVYFFFRELAIERANCERVVYSRVARICKVSGIFAS